MAGYLHRVGLDLVCEGDGADDSGSREAISAARGSKSHETFLASNWTRGDGKAAYVSPGAQGSRFKHELSSQRQC